MGGPAVLAEAVEAATGEHAQAHAFHTDNGLACLYTDAALTPLRSRPERCGLS